MDEPQYLSTDPNAGEPVPQGSPIPNPAEKYGAADEWTLGGLAQNAASDILPTLKDVVAGPVRMAAGIAKRMPGAYTPELAGQDVEMLKGVLRGVRSAAADPAGTLVDVGQAIYERPVAAASFLAPGLGKASPGNVAATAGQKFLRRDPAKLLTKIEQRNMPILKPTEYALRNNPDKNFALITAREGAELGFTKGSKGIVTKEGERALAAKEGNVRDVARGMQDAAQTKGTIQPAVTAMENTVRQAKRNTLDPAETGRAASYVERVRRNPQFSDPIIDPATGQIIGWTPKNLPVSRLARARETLKDANQKGPAFQRQAPSSAATEKTRLSAQHALREQEHGILNTEFGTPGAPTPYTDLQNLRSDIIPTRRVMRQALSREVKKSPWIGWRAGAFQIPGFGTGVLGGSAVAGPFGGVAGGILGTVAGRKLMNYFDSPGYQSAKASRYYQQMQNAPAWNAQLGGEAAVAAPAINALIPTAITEEALRRALLEQMGEPR